MSTAALAWALKQPIRPSSLKFLLVACADVTPENGRTYPSVAYLSEITQQNRKTVLRGLARLVERGFLADTGERKGRTNQVIVYSLQWETNSPKKGTVPMGTGPKTESKSTVFTGGTGPKTGHGTPSLNSKTERKNDEKSQNLRKTVVSTQPPIPRKAGEHALTWARRMNREMNDSQHSPEQVETA
jgi:hypothetical protein